MFSFGESKGRSLFLAINDNNLDKVKKLLDDYPHLLTITDHCDPELEKDLGGTWSMPQFSFGRYEANTPLNFALSMERVDIAQEILQRLRQAKHISSIEQANEAGFTPISMLYLIHGEYLLKYQRGQLVLLQRFSVTERVARQVRVQQLATELMQSVSQDHLAHHLSSILMRDYRLLPLPNVTLRYLEKFLQFGYLTGNTLRDAYPARHCQLSAAFSVTGTQCHGFNYKLSAAKARNHSSGCAESFAQYSIDNVSSAICFRKAIVRGKTP